MIRKLKLKPGLSGKRLGLIIIDDPADDTPMSARAVKDMQSWYDREMARALGASFLGPFSDKALVDIVVSHEQRMLWADMEARRYVHAKIDAMADAAQAEVHAMAHEAQVFFHRSFGQLRRYADVRALDAFRRYDTEGYDRVMEFLQIMPFMSVSEAIEILVLEREILDCMP